VIYRSGFCRDRNAKGLSPLDWCWENAVRMTVRGTAFSLESRAEECVLNRRSPRSRHLRARNLPAMSAADARKTMSDLLKSKRASLTPEMMGLKPREGFSQSKLSRIDTAHLAGISFDHYQRIEQGTSVGVSAEVVAKICDALQMNSVEKDQILALHEVWSSPRRRP